MRARINWSGIYTSIDDVDSPSPRGQRFHEKIADFCPILGNRATMTTFDRKMTTHGQRSSSRTTVSYQPCSTMLHYATGGQTAAQNAVGDDKKFHANCMTISTQRSQPLHFAMALTSTDHTHRPPHTYTQQTTRAPATHTNTTKTWRDIGLGFPLATGFPHTHLSFLSPFIIPSGAPPLPHQDAPPQSQGGPYGPATDSQLPQLPPCRDSSARFVEIWVSLPLDFSVRRRQSPSAHSSPCNPRCYQPPTHLCPPGVPSPCWGAHR